MTRDQLAQLGKIVHHVVTGSAQLIEETNVELGRDLLDELERAGFVLKRARQQPLDFGGRKLTLEQSDRLYPLPRTDEDPRFTVGLLLDVDNVLTKHGYPSIASARSGRDLVELRQSLFRFLYGESR